MEIERGRWAERLPSERRLAQQFQISRPTLHLALCALQNEGLVRAEHGRAWHVVPRVAAPRRPSDRRSEVVLVRYARIAPDLTSVLALTDSLRQKLHAMGYGLQVVDASHRGAHGLSAALRRIDAEYRASYYLLSSVPPEGHRWFAARPTPTIVLGSRAPDVRLPAIEFDPDATITRAVDYLSQRGHRRITLINLPAVTVGMARVNSAFRRSCAAHRRGVIQGKVLTTPARPEVLEAQISRVFSQKRPPSAVIVTHLDFIIGLYTILGELGLRVPRHVSILSTCYWPILDFLRPLPTCYQFSWENMASRVVRILRNHLRLGVWPDTFWNVQPTLREGDSVARTPMD